MNECDIRCSQLQRGAVIAYRLRPSDRPTNPQRLWHGRVEDVHAPMCWVRLVDPGYTGLDETVFFEQIVGIEGEPGYALSSTSDGLCTSR